MTQDRVRRALASLQRPWARLQRRLQDVATQSGPNHDAPACRSVRRPGASSASDSSSVFSRRHPLFTFYEMIKDRHLSLLRKAARSSSADFPQVLSSYHAKYLPSVDSIDLALLWTSSRQARVPALRPPLYPEYHEPVKKYRKTPSTVATLLCDSAIAVAEHMRDSLNLPWTNLTYTALVYHLAAAGRPLEASELVQKSLQNGRHLPVSCITRLISSFGRERQLDRAIQLFRACPPVPHSYVALTTAFSASGQLGNAVALMDQMHKHGITILPQMFHELIARLAHAGDAERLQHVLDCPSRNVRPKATALYRVAFCLGVGGRGPRVWELWHSGELEGDGDAAPLFTGLAEALYRCGHEAGGDEAREMIPWDTPDIDAVGEHLRLARGLLRGGFVQRALDELCGEALPFAAVSQGPRSHLVQVVISYFLRALGYIKNLEGVNRVIDSVLKYRVRMGARMCTDGATSLAACGVGPERIDQLIASVLSDANIHPLETLSVALAVSLAEDPVIRVTNLLVEARKKMKPGTALRKHNFIISRFVPRLRKLVLNDRGSSVEAVRQMADLMDAIDGFSDSLMDGAMRARHLELIVRSHRWHQFDRAFALMDVANATLRGRRITAALIAACKGNHLQNAMKLLVHSRNQKAVPFVEAYLELLRMCDRLATRTDVAYFYRDFRSLKDLPNPSVIATAALALDRNDGALRQDLSADVEKLRASGDPTAPVLDAILHGQPDECMQALLHGQEPLPLDVYVAALRVAGSGCTGPLVRSMGTVFSANRVRRVCTEIERHLLREGREHEIAMVVQGMRHAGVEPPPRMCSIASSVQAPV